MKSPALLLLIILAMPISAQACLNDRYTDWAEKEFRSHYGEASENITHAAASQDPVTLWRWQGCAAGRRRRRDDVAGMPHYPKASRHGEGTIMIGKPLLGWRRIIALGIAGLFLGWVLGSGEGIGSFAFSASRYPMAYQVPRIPGGTSLRMAMIHDVLHERYLRHGVAWNEEQVRESQKVIDDEQGTPGSPRAFSAMDDLAVGLERLHKSAEAAAVMREKLKLLAAQPAAHPWLANVKPVAIPPSDNPRDFELNTLHAISEITPLTAEREAVYTAHANLGTSLIHGSFAQALAGDPLAKQQLRAGLVEIETAIAVNPAAHFGREDWQSVAVRHFLACIDAPAFITQYDLVGNPLNMEIADASRSLLRGAILFHSDSRLDDESRISLRSSLPETGADPQWVKAVQPLRKYPCPFDEPVLGILGMWMLGGGPNPHFALALGTICEQVGQREIAWDAYERAVEMGDRFSPDPDTREKLIAHCRQRQAAIADREHAIQTPDVWQQQMRTRHRAELTFGESWQQSCQQFEAKQIAAGTKLDSTDFYRDFKDFSKLASDPGHVDEIQIVKYSAFGFLDGLPLALASAGTLMILGALTDRHSRKLTRLAASAAPVDP